MRKRNSKSLSSFLFQCFQPGLKERYYVPADARKMGSQQGYKGTGAEGNETKIECNIQLAGLCVSDAAQDRIAVHSYQHRYYEQPNRYEERRH